jgi:isatin hydrolase
MQNPRPIVFGTAVVGGMISRCGGKVGLASLSNLDQLPPTGAIVIAAPLKVIGGSGSPLRVIAITP